MIRLFCLTPGSHDRILRIKQDSEIRLYHYLLSCDKQTHTLIFENNEQHTLQDFTKIIKPERGTPCGSTSSHKEVNVN